MCGRPRLPVPRPWAALPLLIVAIVLVLGGAAPHTAAQDGGAPAIVGRWVVTLTAAPPIVPTGQPVTFTGQVVSAPPGVVTFWATLDVGAGQRVAAQTTVAGLIAQHSYPRPGAYTAILAVTDAGGGTAQATTTIVVHPAAVGWP